MIQDSINQYAEKLEGAIEHLKSEYGKMRTGRAHAGLVEGLLVDAYGTKTPINQVASVTVPEPRTITIQPWDKNIMGAVETAIRNSDLGLSPTNDGNVVRLNIPPLTQERREQIVKSVNQKAEEARITIRNLREEIWKAIQKDEEEGKIGEDEKFSGKEKLQEKIDEYNGKIEELRKKKEEEILNI